MEVDKLKFQIGANIASYRKLGNMTQAGLAEKLNYSDKAVSKWERGESMPDVLTLVELAKLFDITVNDLLVAPNELPESSDSGLEKAMEIVAVKTLKRKADKGIILKLSSVLVWSMALLIYVVLASVGLANGWLAFIYAIPVNAIVLLSLRSAWHDFRWNRGMISVIVWGCLLSLHISLLVFCHANVWRIFLLGIPGQIAIFLWFRLFKSPRREEGETNG